jgi:hypothetical protein
LSATIRHCQAYCSEKPLSPHRAAPGATMLSPARAVVSSLSPASPGRRKPPGRWR